MDVELGLGELSNCLLRFRYSCQSVVLGLCFQILKAFKEVDSQNLLAILTEKKYRICCVHGWTFGMPWERGLFSQYWQSLLEARFMLSNIFKKLIRVKANQSAVPSFVSVYYPG